MTIENDKNENTSDNDADASTDNEKTNKIAEKLKTMGVTPSENKPAEKEARRFSPLLITLLLAVPAVGVIAYMNAPDHFDKLLSSISNYTSLFTNKDQQSPDNVNTQSKVPAESVAGSWDQPEATTLNRFHEPQLDASKRAELEKRRLEFQKQNPEPQWVAQQRAEMEKRRLEFQKQNPEPQWMAQQRAEMEKRRLEYQKQNPEPQWVIQQRAEMEKRRLEYQAQNPRNYAANWERSMQPPEPPQWVKDRQAEMQREMAKYQQNMSNHSNGQAYSRGPGYMQHPRMNSYQPNSGNNNQLQPRQNPNPVRAYPQPNPYYYNAPPYGFGPNHGPYGYPY